MSAVGQILKQVEETVMRLLAGFTSGEDEQNQRLSVLEDRVTALEASLKPAARGTTARAGTASVKAEAKNPQ